MEINGMEWNGMEINGMERNGEAEAVALDDVGMVERRENFHFGMQRAHIRLDLAR